MCTVTGDRYVCESPACVALGAQRAGVVRRAVLGFLDGADPDCLADVALVVDAVLGASYESGRPAVRLEVLRRPETGICWLSVAACSATVGTRLQARSPHEITWRMLDAVCLAWGVARGDAADTLWAEMPLAAAARQEPAGAEAGSAVLTGAAT